MYLKLTEKDISLIKKAYKDADNIIEIATRTTGTNTVKMTFCPVYKLYYIEHDNRIHSKTSAKKALEIFNNLLYFNSKFQ